MELECDVLSEAVSDLEKVRDELRSVSHDPHAWKWVVVAAHNALQGFMVASLEAGSGLPSLKPKSAAKVLAWLRKPTRTNSPPPPEITLSFAELLEAVKGTAMKQFTHSRRLPKDVARDESLRRLNGLRNRFMHFPGALTWYLELDDLPEMIRDAMGVCRTLAFESGNIASPLDDDLAERASSALDAINGLLEPQRVRERSSIDASELHVGSRSSQELRRRQRHHPS